MQSYKLLKNLTIYLYWQCGLEINIYLNIKLPSFHSRVRLSKMFQRKRYYFSVVRDKELVNLVWHLTLLNGNSLQENGIIILDFILTLPLLEELELSNRLLSFSLVHVSLLKMESLENGHAVCCSQEQLRCLFTLFTSQECDM